MKETVGRQSRIGKKEIFLPKGVSVTKETASVFISGPFGNFSFVLDPSIDLICSQQSIRVETREISRNLSRIQGLVRALIQNMVSGVSVEYKKVLQLVGTGYRAEIKDSCIFLSLGFSHPIVLSIPSSIKIQVPSDSKGTLIFVSGPDKSQVGQLAATIRSFRSPEPYAGKGVRYQHEIVKRKEGKTGKSSK